MNFLAQAVNRGGALGWHIIRRTRERGFLGVWRQLGDKFVQKLWSVGSREVSPSDAFDSTYGTDTAKTVGVWALDIPRGKLVHASRYETLAPELFSASLAELQIRHEEFVFIDLGSGKGRALLLASRFPFKEIIGVELSAGLNVVANRNLRAFKAELQKCRKIQSICQDVIDYQFPEQNIVLYLYNPFDEHMMQSVVSKVEDLIRRYSRRVYVLYHHPLHKNVWDQSECFEVIKIQDRCAVYVSKH